MIVHYQHYWIFLRWLLMIGDVITLTNRPAIIQGEPFSRLVNQRLPSGAPDMKAGFTFFLGNTNTGDTLLTT